MPKKKTSHVVMRFSFTRMDRAANLSGKILGLGIDSTWGYDANLRGWVVTTDTRILEHAAELKRYIYGRESEGA